ncbi:hypothetical protein [Parageobacillus toebii]|uniref:hypothetical protein n=1 Tax=Parageobacillus toebii TaxID=153151 RepID=UPI001FCA979A|nr:hypothetical protein [Parageobacillus toebii]
MTIICYNEKKQQWFHQDEGRTYVFGYQHPLAFSNELPSFSFHVKEQRGKVGPLVGIMISESSIPALLKRKKTIYRADHHFLARSGKYRYRFTI